jgi:hypothetical protein
MCRIRFANGIAAYGEVPSMFLAMSFSAFGHESALAASPACNDP